MERQAILERQGWKFVRIRGSQFLRDPDMAMAPVFERLDNMGIPPEAFDSSHESSSQLESGLRDRIIRRAEEIRHGWERPITTDNETPQPNLWEDQDQSQTERPSQLQESRRAANQDEAVNRPEEKPFGGFRVGSRVRHPTFGDGTVLACEGGGPDAKLTVAFSTVGVKKLNEKLAALEPL
jgi:hypothetical protein